MSNERIRRLTREALGEAEPRTLAGDCVTFGATIALIVVAALALADILL